MASAPSPTVLSQSVKASEEPKKSTTVDIDADVPDISNQLPPKPSPELKPHVEFIHCMPPDIPTYRKYSLFLAGSIEMGRAIHWQKRMVDYLQDLPITVCNPRRGQWDTTSTPTEKNKAFNYQVQWELSALEHVSLICFFFDKNTISPVTMLELGLWAKSKKVVVCCDSGFHKAGNVHITCRRYGIDFVEKFEDLVPLVKKMLVERGMTLNEEHNLVNEEGNRIQNEGPVVKQINDIFTGIVVEAKTEAPRTEKDAVIQTHAQPPSTADVRPEPTDPPTPTKKRNKLTEFFGKAKSIKGAF